MSSAPPQQVRSTNRPAHLREGFSNDTVPETWDEEDYKPQNDNREIVEDPWTDGSTQHHAVTDHFSQPDPLRETETQRYTPQKPDYESSYPQGNDQQTDPTAAVLSDQTGCSAERLHEDDLESSGTDLNFDDEEPDDHTLDRSFWGDLAYIETTGVQTTTDFIGPADDFGVTDYDDDAHQSPWAIEPEESADSLLHERQKASEVFSRLPHVSQREKERTLDCLIDFFRNYAHWTTYHAILRAADRGVSSETLRNMVALRDVWVQRNEWWLHRYGKPPEIRVINNGESSLSWKLAQQICEARSDFLPENMIDEAWMHQWMCLHPWEQGYLSFPRFIETKVQHIEESFQELPNLSDLRNHQPDEISESHWNGMKRFLRETGDFTIGQGRLQSPRRASHHPDSGQLQQADSGNHDG